jgi:hypothetical protein
MRTITNRVVISVIGLLFIGAASANAAIHRGAVIVPRVEVIRPFYYYDPFWGPWYPYAYAYPYALEPRASIRTEVVPKDAEVYVDGYYAGHASDFDGVFKQLHVVPGGHAVTLHLKGFRTVTEDVYVRPDSTFKLSTTLDRLAAGETSAPVPTPYRPSPGRGTPRT